MSSRFAGLIAFLGVTASVPAADWPQWRGPDRNEISLETGIRTDFTKSQPKLLWTFSNSGNGYSGPAVVGNVLYLLGTNEGQEFAFALDTDTGTEKWRQPLGKLFKNGPWGDGPRSTPTIDGSLMYVIRPSGAIHCLETANGHVVWEKDFKTDFDGRLMSGWGYSESPLVDGNLVVFTPGGAGGTMVALDKHTGKQVWRTTELKDDAAYSSIIAADVDGVRQYIQLTGRERQKVGGVVGVSAKDGKLLWYYERNHGVATIPTAIYTDHHVYATAGYGCGCDLIKLEKNGEKFTASKVYANKNLTNHHGGVVLLDGFIYGFSEGRGLVCQDLMTGQNKWEEKGKGHPQKGAVTCVAGHLFCFDESTGNLYVVAASPKGYQESGVIPLPKKSSIRSANGRAWTHPVIANGKLYLRDQDLLFCFDMKQ